MRDSRNACLGKAAALDACNRRECEHRGCPGEASCARTQPAIRPESLRHELEGDEREHRAGCERERGGQEAAHVLDDEEREHGADRLRRTRQTAAQN